MPCLALPKALRLYSLGLLWLLSGNASANVDLTEQRVRELLLRHLPANSQHTQIQVQGSAALPACDNPEAFLPAPDRPLRGRVTVGIRCAERGETVRYLQAQLSTHGRYVVARQRIAAGELIKAEMLEIKQGPLERLPANAVREPQSIIGLQASRSLSPGSTVLSNSFRQPWLVARNAPVTLQAQGAGFTLSRQAKALDNGSLGNKVRVQSQSGKTLRAEVVGPNRLLVRF
jgi:flagella basal body P-ring formation protein FlgA